MRRDSELSISSFGHLAATGRTAAWVIALLPESPFRNKCCGDRTAPAGRRYCITRHLGLVAWRQLGLAADWPSGRRIAKYRFAVGPRFRLNHSGSQKVYTSVKIDRDMRFSRGAMLTLSLFSLNAALTADSHFLNDSTAGSTQPCIPLGSLNRVPALIGWGKGGNVTPAGWGNTLWLHVACEFPYI